jgi:hypothetical protein
MPMSHLQMPRHLDRTGRDRRFPELDLFIATRDLFTDRINLYLSDIFRLRPAAAGSNTRKEERIRRRNTAELRKLHRGYEI